MNLAAIVHVDPMMLDGGSQIQMAQARQVLVTEADCADPQTYTYTQVSMRLWRCDKALYSFSLRRPQDDVLWLVRQENI